MKKVLFLSMALGVALYAGSNYSIYAGTFTNDTSEAQINLVKNNLANALAQNSNVSEVVVKNSNGYKAVIVETKSISKADAALVLDKVKSLKYKDAYMKSGLIGKTAADTNTVNTVSVTSSHQKSDLKTQGEYLKTAQFENKTNAKITHESVEGGLSLEKAVKDVLLQNPKMRESIYRYIQVGKDLDMANNAYYPTLDLAAAYGYRYDTRKYMSNKKRVHDDDIGGYAKLILNENLYNGGFDSNNIKKQSNKMDAAAFYVNQTADRLVLDMTKSYLEVLKQKKLLDIVTKNVASHKSIYALISDRTQSGYSRISEEKQAGSRLTLAEANFIAQQNNYQDALSTFYKLYGKNVKPENLTLPKFAHTLPSSMVEVYERAMKCNPSVLLQESNIKVANYDHKQKNAPFLPKIDLEATAGYDTTGELYNNYTDNNEYSLMLKMNYNLFNKGNDKLAKEKAEVAIQEEMQNRDSLLRDLAESTRFSWDTYKFSSDKMKFLEKHLKYATETLSTYRDEFKLGKRDLINLLDAESEYFNALKEIESTKSDMLFAKYRLLDNMGVISDSFVPGLSKSYTLGACSLEGK